MTPAAIPGASTSADVRRCDGKCKFDLILFWSLNRFSREGVSAASSTEQARAPEAPLVFVLELRHDAIRQLLDQFLDVDGMASQKVFLCREDLGALNVFFCPPQTLLLLFGRLLLRCV